MVGILVSFVWSALSGHIHARYRPDCKWSIGTIEREGQGRWLGADLAVRSLPTRAPQGLVCGPCGESRPTSRLARAGRTWWPVLATDALTARRNRSHALAAPLLRARQPAGLAIRAEQENRGLASGNRGGLLDGFENHERASCVICWRGLSGRRRRSRHEPPAPRRTGQRDTQTIVEVRVRLNDVSGRGPTGARHHHRVAAAMDGLRLWPAKPRGHGGEGMARRPSGVRRCGTATGSASPTVCPERRVLPIATLWAAAD